MNDNGFYLFTEYKEKFKRMSDSQLGQLIRALFEYKLTGEEPEIDDFAVGLAFDVVRADIDRQTENYKKRAEAGRKGGQSRKQDEANESIAKQEEANESIAKQTEANESNEEQEEANSTIKRKEKEKKIKENKREENIERETPSKEGVKRERFVPPTLEEVQDYCEEKHLAVDPIVFFQYFTEGNWTDAKGQRVRNWKQKILTWNSHGNGTRAQPENKLDQKLREIASWR